LQAQVCVRCAICNRDHGPGRESPADLEDRNRHGACFRDRPETFMADLLLILATAALFALSWGYARLCEKL